MRFPPRAAWLAGVGLAQFGEFGFVILQLAIHEGVVLDSEIGPLLNAGILSMFLTPLMVYKAPHFTAGSGHSILLPNSYRPVVLRNWKIELLDITTMWLLLDTDWRGVFLPIA